MKTLISLFIIFTLLLGIPSAAIAQDSYDSSGVEGQIVEDYIAGPLSYTDPYDYSNYNSSYSSAKPAEDSGVLWGVLGLCFFSTMTVISVYHRKER